MSVKNWLFNIALKKGLKRGLQALIAVFGTARLKEAGVTIDETQLLVAVFAGLEVVRNWLKHKMNAGWL